MGGSIHRQRKEEGAAFAWCRLEAYFSFVCFYDAFTGSEADAASFVLLTRMQACEHGKDAIMVFRCDADALISDRKDVLILALMIGYVDLGHGLRRKLDGVDNEVLENLAERRREATQVGPLDLIIIGFDGGLAFVDGLIAILDSLIEQLA